MKLEIKNVSMASLVISSVPLVVLLVGVLGGLVTYVFVPNPQIEPMRAGAKLLSIGIFSLMYTVLVSSLLVLLGFLYNLLTGVLGMKGVVFEFEEVADHE
jgi:hypothetical protein